MSDTRYLLISTMKNEGPYILEWIIWHRLIGFDDILVYTNDCEDGADAILARLTEMGLARHEPNKVLRRGPHKSALKYAMDHDLTQRADWIYVADVDEFLNVKLGDGSVRALTAALPEADCIPVTWRLFSHGDEIAFRDAPVLETMTDAELPLEAGGPPDRFVKSLFRPTDALLRFGLHGPQIEPGAGFRWVAPDGRALDSRDNLTRPAREFGYAGAQVNHYAVRSLDGYLVKRDRGRANHVNHVLGVDYWRKMCRGGEEDLSIQRRLPELKAGMAELMKDAPLAALHRRAVGWHEAKIVELRGIEEFRALRAEILALVEAGDHRRAAKAAPAPAPKSARDLVSDPNRIRALCAELRQLLERAEPLEAAVSAAARLDEIERGLFGGPPR